MATVRMTLGEAVDGDLPKTCLKCGQPAEHWVRKKMSWHPSWVWVLLLGGLLPFVIVAMLLTKRATLYAPMCVAHRNHWFLRSAVSIGGLLAFIALIIVWVNLMGAARPTREVWGALVGWSLVVGVISWLITLVVLNTTAVRPQEITDRDLLLQGVSVQFADDFDRMLEEHDRERAERRERKRALRDQRPIAADDGDAIRASDRP